MARTVKMIDTSFWQASNRRYPPVKPMDWALAAVQGVLGAYIKASDGLDVDPELERNFEGAWYQAIKRGAYHFFRAFETGKNQAKHFLSTTWGMAFELPPALDVEVVCTAKELWAWIKHVHEQTGIWAIVYTSPGAWAKVIDGWTLDGLRPVRYKQLIAERCDLWQAQYPKPEYDDGSRIIKLDPIEPWAKLGKTAVIHQYSARNKLGPAYGSMGSKAIDLDLADEAWFKRWPFLEVIRVPVPELEPEPAEPEEVEMKTRFEALVDGQRVRSEPSTAGGNRTVVGSLSKGQVLYPALEIVVSNPIEVWIRFDAANGTPAGWVAAVHGGYQYLKAIE